MNFFSMRKLRLREISKSLQSDGRKWLDQHLHPELSGPRVCTCIAQYGSQQMCGGTNGKEPACQFRRFKRCRLYPWIGKIPWRRKWQLTPVFLPGESPWTEEPGRKQSVGS